MCAVSAMFWLALREPRDDFSKTMEFELSKDVPTVFKTFLEQILCFDEVWSHMAKGAILVIFGEN